MKKNSSILGRYSDGSYKRKGGSKSSSGIIEYKQLYKGSSQAKNVTEKKTQTLEEKIASRKKPVSIDTDPVKEEARVTIGGISYVVKSEDASPERIIKVGELANEIYEETKERNPYVATIKTSILSLFECCDRLLTLRAENNALRTELMYYQQLDRLNKEKNKDKTEPTPMEILAKDTSKDNE
ncbi:MAG: cell division protein ZapA [Saccharofermentans sp.]|nr:cell division protein ZapA [Saccharofermentans sp.]